MTTDFVGDLATHGYEPVSAAKARLRSLALARRRELSIAARTAFASRLAEEGVRIAQAWRSLVVSAYYPLADEPDTLPLLSALDKLGFRIALPRTVSASEPLQFCAWRPGEHLERGPMKIWEPGAQAVAVAPDLLFVPLAAFDRKGGRIGFGGGHYDRTLSKLRGIGRIRAVGVAFSVSEVLLAPSESHDETLDYVLTESELINCLDAR